MILLFSKIDNTVKNNHLRYITSLKEYRRYSVCNLYFFKKKIEINIVNGTIPIDGSRENYYYRELEFISYSSFYHIIKKNLRKILNFGTNEYKKL